jgi:acetylornithine deacetylase/succinyl-diaminopimelate desuccinylase-like protein
MSLADNFWMELFRTPFVNYYKNASNIIAVLEGESGFNSDGSTRTSLLVNCHYDSVPYAIGEKTCFCLNFHLLFCL